jgi:enamine deaminase RidA (YjgF/YER057c/UK114 family)
VAIWRCGTRIRNRTDREAELTPEERITELGLELPSPTPPIAAYVPAVRTGNLVFISGQGPVRDGAFVCTGKVGSDVDLETAKDAAKITCLNGLAALKAEIGELSKVTRVVKLTVFVNSAPGFDQQPLVGNGASELLQEIFGDAGRHARSAVGMAELPFGMPVEIEFVFEVA